MQFPLQAVAESVCIARLALLAHQPDSVDLIISVTACYSAGLVPALCADGFTSKDYLTCHNYHYQGPRATEKLRFMLQ
jgi:hypothetical protein